MNVIIHDKIKKSSMKVLKDILNKIISVDFIALGKALYLINYETNQLIPASMIEGEVVIKKSKEGAISKIYRKMISSQATNYANKKAHSEPIYGESEGPVRQGFVEGGKWLIGHRRGLREQRLRAYVQVLRSRLRARPD